MFKGCQKTLCFYGCSPIAISLGSYMDKAAGAAHAPEKKFTQDVSVLSRSCLGLVSVFFGDVSVLFWCCLGLVSAMSRCCFGDVSVMSRCCFGDVSVIPRSGLGRVSVLSLSFFGDV